jgi:hypothetical protein
MDIADRGNAQGAATVRHQLRLWVLAGPTTSAKPHSATSIR